MVCIISGESNPFFCGDVEFIRAVGGGGETRTGDIAGDAEWDRMCDLKVGIGGRGPVGGGLDSRKEWTDKVDEGID